MKTASSLYNKSDHQPHPIRPGLWGQPECEILGFQRNGGRLEPELNPSLKKSTQPISSLDHSSYFLQVNTS